MIGFSLLRLRSVDQRLGATPVLLFQFLDQPISPSNMQLLNLLESREQLAGYGSIVSVTFQLGDELALLTDMLLALGNAVLSFPEKLLQEQAVHAKSQSSQRAGTNRIGGVIVQNAQSKMANVESQLQGVRPILQDVEDALLNDGQDDITLATRHGTSGLTPNIIRRVLS